MGQARLPDVTVAPDRAWLEAFGAPDAPVMADAFEPSTLKQILDGALALGAAAGRLEEAMRVVAAFERRLDALSRTLGIDRRSQTVAGASMPRIAVVSSLEEAEAVLPGRWVPGLAAAAGARAVGPVEGGSDMRLDTPDLFALAPEVLIIALVDPAGDPLETSALARRAGWSGPTWAVDGTRFVNQPGPAVARSIELIAYAVHGARSGVTPEVGEVDAWNAGPTE